MSAAPRVLALVTDAFGGSGGIAQYNRDLLDALVESGAASAIVAVPRHGAGVADLPAGIRQMRARRGRVRYAVAALAAAVRLRPGIVFCGHLYMAPLAAVIARLTGARLVVQTHGIEAWPPPSRLRRAALEQADLVLSVSRCTRGRVVGWAAIAPERAAVIPDTVGPAFVPGDGGGFRRSLGLGTERVLLTVGRLDSRERYKGHDRIIAAIPGLVAGGHDVVYLVIGEGDDRPRLEALARATGVAGRVRFLGTVPRDRLVDAYRAADLFVMPSTGEGFGIAFLEAMACGTPALGLAVGGATDALADGELGTTVAEDGLAAAISRLLTRSRPDPRELSARTHARFGREAFRARVGEVFGRLWAPA